MAAYFMLDFLKPDYWPMNRIRLVFSIFVPNLCKHFHWRPNYGRKTKFKMASVAILNLLPVAIFNTANFQLLITTTIQNFMKNISMHYWIIIIFEIQDGGRPPCSIFWKPDHWSMNRLRLLIFHDLMQKCWLTRKLWRPKIEIQDGGRTWRG